MQMGKINRSINCILNSKDTYKLERNTNLQLLQKCRFTITL